MKFKPVSGKDDQAGGVIWRAQDADSFSGAGKVGIWTKADSVTLFDDFDYGAK
jgi:hypothetical protein